MPRKASGNFDPNAYTNAFKKDNYDRIGVLIPKGRKADVTRKAMQEGETVNAMINRLLMKELGISEEDWKSSKEQANGD